LPTRESNANKPTNRRIQMPSFKRIFQKNEYFHLISNEEEKLDKRPKQEELCTKTKQRKKKKEKL